MAFLPILLTAQGGRLFQFGIGCARGSSEPKVLLLAILKSFLHIPYENINHNLLLGVEYLNDNQCHLINELLDCLLNAPELRKLFLQIQLSIRIDKKAVERIKLSLNDDLSPSHFYEQLAHGEKHKMISDNDLCIIIDLLWDKKNGQAVVIRLLKCRFFGMSKDEIKSSQLVVNRAQKALLDFDYSTHIYSATGIGYDCSEIAKVCFALPSLDEMVRSLFEKLAINLLNYEFDHFQMFLSTLI